MKDKDKLFLSVCYDKQLEGTLSQEEADQLEELVKSDRSAALFYHDLSLQNIALHRSRTSLTSVHTELEDIDEVEGAEIKEISVVTKLALVASILLAFGIGWNLNTKPSKGKVIATLSEVHYAQWSESSLPTEQGSELSKGVMRLDRGVAVINFTSGVSMKLEAPAHIELLSDMHCLLYSGLAVADVPKQAIGFRLDTPSAKVIDYGTRFLVQHQPGQAADASRIEVLEGEVEVQNINNHEKMRLFDGDGVIANSKKLEKYVSNEEDELTLDSLAEQQNVFELSTSMGMGEMTSVVKSDRLQAHDKQIKSMILIKRVDNISRRKGYLKFDLNEVKEKDYKSVELTFNMVKTGIGTMVDMDEAEFEVYSIDEDHDDWTSETITRGNAPDFMPKGFGRVNPDVSQLIGRFSLQKGQLEGHISLSNEILREMINKDQDGLITFVIRRETLGDRERTLVHGIATDKHPTSSEPKLIFHY